MIKEEERVERLGVNERSERRITRFTSLERLVCKRENFVLNSLIYFQPVKRFENRSDMMKFRCFGDGTCS